MERYSYDVFGEPNRVSDINNPYMFTGRRYDPEAGLYYYRARYYDYSTGRFLEPDPIGYTDSMNLYQYCLNNPINWFDPWGQKVYLSARRVKSSASMGVHTFIEIVPDHPEDFADKKGWVIGGYLDKKIDKLVSQTDNKTDLNWKRKKLKARYEIKQPEKKSDTEFIKDIMIAFQRYKSGSRDYEAFPEIDDNEGNCNTVSSGALVGAGVPVAQIKKLDPFGFNPGLGEPLPEMVTEAKKSCP